MSDWRALNFELPRLNFARGDTPDPYRRALLRSGFLGLGLFASGGWLAGCGHGFNNESGASGETPLQSQIASLGPLQATPDASGLRLPAGFTSRVVARSGLKPLDAAHYVWHSAPDGAAVFPTEDGGWIYVSNSERSRPNGGVGALRFSTDGEIVDAYSILDGTNRNCAGGLTPWGTWLSCEEDFFLGRGRVVECDPTGAADPVFLPGMGLFVHEAVAVDPATHQIYETEDRSDGGFYRFTPADPQPDGRSDLRSGTLEIAVVENFAAVLVGGSSGVSWETIPDPFANPVSTRKQVAGRASFNGGEGIWYAENRVYFSTKGDRNIWVYDIAAASLSLFYESMSFEPDNVAVSPGGDVLVAEDGPGMQLVAITDGGQLVPLVEVVDHSRSEIAGPAFDPSGTRLYLSSQRGATGSSSSGVTYEISGPFVA
ncbi:MAG: alkaline phosphatase PhoX [Myxococcota bacterium]